MKRSFNFKNITTSMLAIMLCVAMLFSFSLSVYAEIVGTVVVATGEGYQNCRGIGSLDKKPYGSYKAMTQIVDAEDLLVYMDVILIIEDASPEGITEGSDRIDIIEGDSIRDVEVTVNSSYYIYYVISSHSMIDEYGTQDCQMITYEP